MRNRTLTISALIGLIILGLLLQSAIFAAKSQPQTKLPKMIELYATWCPPCQKMQPILAELEKEYKGKVQFVRYDIDKNKDVVKKYKVEAIPVQLFFDKNGKQAMRHTGFLSRAEILAQFKKMGISPAK